MCRLFKVMKARQMRGVNLKIIIQKRINEAGIWCGPNKDNIHRAANLSIFCFILTNLTQILALFMAKNDPKKLFGCLSVLSFCLMGFYKLWSLVRKQSQWQAIINQALSLEKEQTNNSYSSFDYESDDEVNYSSSKHIHIYTRNFLAISTYLVRIYNFTAVVYIASPFLEYGIYLYKGQDVTEYPHILPGWAPLDTNIFGYIISILVEAVAAIYCVKVHVAFDVTAVGLMIFIRGQFSLLHDFSERIGGKGNSCYLSKRRDERAHYRIQQCHHIHVLLIKSVHELSKLIKNILGIYFFVSTLTLCSVAVQLNWEHVSTPQLISLLQYMGATLTQLFLFCYYGDAVLNESSVGLGKGPFWSASWCLSAKIRREIAILCVAMSRPYCISAGPFSSLDLPSFIQIVRTAYSYYAFLRQKS